MLVKKIGERDNLKYNNLSTEYGTVYNTIDWLKMFGDRAQVCGIYDKGDNLIGGFTIYEEKKFGLRIFRNPPFTPTIGPFLKIDAKNPVAVMGIWKEALSSMAEFIEGLPYSVVSFSLDKDIVDTQPFIWKKFKVIVRYKYLLDLSHPTEDIWKGMSHEKKKAINRATEDGLLAKQIDDFKVIQALVLKTFSRQEQQFHKDYLDRILFDFANKKNCCGFVTFKEDRPLACEFIAYDKNTAHGVISGYDHNYKHRGAGPLAFWEAIKYAKESGLKYFDFEGSMIPRLERYFREFGGQLTPYYTVNKAKLPLEMLLKFFKRDLF